jgi:hypothetical protein
MEFLYAGELKTQFSVFGHFYNLNINGQIYNCRSVLEIVSSSIERPAESNPCVVVVMMNPGSSTPADPSYIPTTYTVSEITCKSWVKDVIPTKPDNAQYQIMRLMVHNGWRHARILNLSDLRNGNSVDFAEAFTKSLELDPSAPHSLVNKERRKELLKYCSQCDVVIAAWGSNAVLQSVAEEFLSIIPNVAGLPLNQPWFRYPSPYRKDQKIAWLNAMNDSLKYSK